jgi:hypothetical protein
MWYRMTLSYSRHSRGWIEDRRPDSNVAKEAVADFIERLWKVFEKMTIVFLTEALPRTTKKLRRGLCSQPFMFIFVHFPILV